MVASAGLRRLFASVFLWLIGLATAAAHPADFTRLIVTVKADGSFEMTVNVEGFSHVLGERVSDAGVEALRSGTRNALAVQLTEANERFRREVVVRTDLGEAALPADGWRYPSLAAVEEALARSPLMSGEITFTGHLPAGARTLSVRLPYALGETLQIVQLPDGRTDSAPVAAGEYGAEIALPKIAQRIRTGEKFAPRLSLGFVHTLPNGLGAQVTETNIYQPTGGRTDSAPAAASEHGREIALPATAPPTPNGGAFGRYVSLGFVHILPRGLDHILFVLGLFLLSARLRPLLWQVSAFTLSHTLTLGLSLYGVIKLPVSVVEPLIAASIVCIAVENLCTDRLRVWRPFVVFGFGLLHGLGFACVLTELGLPANARLNALLGFNLGVEFGQLAVLALAFAALGWARKRSWYRHAIVVPASLIIAAVALYWTIERLH